MERTVSFSKPFPMLGFTSAQQPNIFHVLFFFLCWVEAWGARSYWMHAPDLPHPNAALKKSVGRALGHPAAEQLLSLASSPLHLASPVVMLGLPKPARLQEKTSSSGEAVAPSCSSIVNSFVLASPESVPRLGVSSQHASALEQDLRTGFPSLGSCDLACW